jgi:hypothetical protein
MKPARLLLVALLTVSSIALAAQVGGRVTELVAQYGFFDNLTVAGQSVCLEDGTDCSGGGGGDIESGTFTCNWNTAAPSSTEFLWQRAGLQVQIQPNEYLAASVATDTGAIEDNCIPVALRTAVKVRVDNQRCQGAGGADVSACIIFIDGADMRLYQADFATWGTGTLEYFHTDFSLDEDPETSPLLYLLVE